MEQTILLEKVKELIGDKKVKAAVLYSFNFDAVFFENYICPIFIPEIEFGNNQLQNAILWKKYQSELPPIVVFCDEHHKGDKGPSLGYKIVPVSVTNSDKPGSTVNACFHPKHSFILCDDDTLVFITGSNNLTFSGWCKNIEGVYIQHFKKYGLKREFPKEFLREIRNYVSGTKSSWINNEIENNPALKLIRSFIDSKKQTDRNKHYFFSSHTETFWEFISYFKEIYNSDNAFEKIEIIAPYLSKESHFENFTRETGCNDIRISIPFEDIETAGIDKETFDAINHNENYTWHYFDTPNDQKKFRFCHAKLYRLWGNKKIITIVGSVNFTEAAFKGMESGGNLESAVAVVKKITKEDKPWLNIKYNNKELQFTKSRLEQEEEETIKRVIPFDLEFIMDWETEQFSYKNKKLSKPGVDQKGLLVFDKVVSNIEINKISTTRTASTIHLDQSQLKSILNSNLVGVENSKTKDIYTYFITHEKPEKKPLPEKYNLSASELFKLWALLNETENPKIQARLIEKFLAKNQDEFGNTIEGELLEQKSIFNQVGQHINGLMDLLEKIQTLEKANIKNKEKIEYYKYHNNVDTLIGYLSILKEAYKTQELKLGHYWFLLTFMEQKFYKNKSKKPIPKVIKEDLEQAEKSMLEDIDNKKLTWLKKQINV